MNRNIAKLSAIAPNFLCYSLTILFVSVYLFSGCSSIYPKCLQYSKTIDLKGRKPLLNGEIYCLMHKIGGDYRVDILDTAGTLKRSISLDSNKLRVITTVDETEYGIWRIYVTNDVIWFQTLADRIVPFSVSTGALCGEILQGYAIDFNLSTPNQNKTLFYQPQKTEITLFVNTNGKLESYDLTVEKDGSAVSIEYAFLSNSKNEIVIIPWNSDGNVLLYELK